MLEFDFNIPVPVAIDLTQPLALQFRAWCQFFAHRRRKKKRKAGVPLVLQDDARDPNGMIEI